MFSSEISEYQDTEAREKNNYALLEYWSTNVLFSIEIFMSETELVVTES